MGGNVLKIRLDGVDLTSLLLEDRKLLDTAITGPIALPTPTRPGQLKTDRMEGGNGQEDQNGPLGSQAEERNWVPEMGG